MASKRVMEDERPRRSKKGLRRALPCPSHPLAMGTAPGIADVGMGELRRQIEYKADWYGRTVVVVDRWFPSSETCSDCGSYQQQMPLSVRVWTCPDCGARHDRDVNAAKNILKFSTVGNTGYQARGAGQNLSGHESLTCDEARTDAGKFTEAVRLERAA